MKWKPEYKHLVRAMFWILFAPVVLLTPLKNSVALVILLSLYANFAADLASYNAKKADRHASARS